MSQSIFINDGFFIVEKLTGSFVAIAIIISYAMLCTKDISTGMESRNPQEQDQQPLFPKNHPEDTEPQRLSQDEIISVQIKPN